MFLLPIAVSALIAFDEATKPLSREVVLRHLKIGPRGEDDSGDPAYVPDAGNAYLAVCGERCHDALLDILDDMGKGKLRNPKDVPFWCVFNVLSRQKCDRSRFLPFAEKYALTDRSQTKLTERAQCYALNLLGQIGKPDHAEKLAPFLQDPDKEVRREALKAMENLGDNRHGQLVLDQLTAPRPTLPPLTEDEKKELTRVGQKLLARPRPDESEKDKPKK